MNRLYPSRQAWEGFSLSWQCLGILVLWQVVGLSGWAAPPAPERITLPNVTRAEPATWRHLPPIRQGDSAGLRVLASAPVAAPLTPSPLFRGWLGGRAWLVPLLSLGMLALLVWIWVLRWEAREQKEVLHHWLSREARAEDPQSALLERLNDAILIFEPNSEIILDANRKACELFGRPLRELVGASLKSLTNDGPCREAETQEILRREACTDFATVHYRKDGRPISLLVSSSVIPFAGRSAILSTYRDVTELAETTEALRRADDILEAVSFAAEKLFSASDGKESIRAVLEHLGLSAGVSRAYIFENHTAPEGELVSSLRYEWAAPGITPQIDNPELRDFSWKANDVAAWREELHKRKIVQGGLADVPQAARQHLQALGIQSFILVPIFVGEIWWGFMGFDDCQRMRQWSVVETEALRAATKTLGAALQRKQADETLAKANELVKAVVQASPVAMLSLDAHGQVGMWNPAAERLFGWTEAEVLGKPLPTVPQEEWENHKSIAARALRGEAVAHLEVRRRRKDGAWIDIRINTAPIFDAHGKIVATVGVLDDITERKQAEEKLKRYAADLEAARDTAQKHAEEQARLVEALAQERDLLHTLMDNVPDYIYFKDRESRFVRTNMAHAKTFGLDDPSQVVGRTDFDFFSAEHAQPAYDDEQEIIRTGKPMAAKEEKETWPDGRVTWVSTIKMPLRDAHGAIIGTFGVSRDITQHKQAEEALAYERDLLRSLMDNLPDFIYFKDRESCFVRINAAHARGFGLSDPGQARGKTDFDFFTAEHAQQAYDDEQEIIRTGKPMAAKEEKETWPDGRVTWASTIKMPLRDAQGSIIGTFGVSRDITERKRAEAENLRLVAAIEQAAEGIVITDLQGSIQYANPAFTWMTGYSRQELIGQNPRLLKSGTHDAKFYQEMWETILAGRTWHGEIVNRRKDGTLYTEEMTITPVRDAAGATTSFTAVKQDITRRKAAEEELRWAKDAAEAANQAKSDFLANMSHELRTPLNGILGMTELLGETPLSPEQSEYLQIQRSSTESLLTLVNDLLDFSNAEAGKVELDMIEFKLPETLGDALKALAIRAHQKGLELACSLAPDVPEQVVGDPGRFRQILNNLVGNAIKFTEKGEIVVRVNVDSQSKDQARLHVSVRDTGIGIPPEKQQIIFKAFEQADTSTTRRYGGTGLGLSITAHLVGLMGGRIWLESVCGQGSTFHFTLQLALGEGPGAPPMMEMARLRNLPTLVVDDNPTNRQILVEMLKRWNIFPSEAEGGPQAWTLLEESKKSGKLFSLILLDAQMPHLDGFTLATWIRRDPDWAGTVILLLTSGGMRGDAARCRELGIAAYLVKPIKQSELLKAILMALGTSGGPPPLVTRHSLRETGRKLRVLLAEDNPVNQALVTRLLEKKGHAVEIATNGKEVLDKLMRTPAPPFDLILMDMQMPEMNGEECIARIRAKENGAGSGIPIIALIARATNDDRERILAAGLEGYLTTPVRAQELYETLERFRQLPSGTTEGEAPGAPRATVLDRQQVLARFEGDERSLGKLISGFFDVWPRLVATARQAAARSDTAEFQFAAHALENNLTLLSAPAALKAVQFAEEVGRTRGLEHAGEALAQLEEELDRLQPALANLGKETTP